MGQNDMITKALDKIVDELKKLDKHLITINETDSKIKSFIAQEEAIHEIKRIIRQADKIERLEGEAVADVVMEIEDDLESEERILANIGETFTRLDKTISSISDDDNRVKSFIEQKKALHEAKRLLSQVDRFGKLIEEELNS